MVRLTDELQPGFELAIPVCRHPEADIGCCFSVTVISGVQLSVSVYRSVISSENTCVNCHALYSLVLLQMLSRFGSDCLDFLASSTFSVMQMLNQYPRNVVLYPKHDNCFLMFAGHFV